MWNARSSGALDRMIGLAEDCMADYDENGWTDPTWLNPGEKAATPAAPRAAAAGKRTGK
jgi:4-hydroxyphenylacetate 3-monooxygenase